MEQTLQLGDFELIAPGAKANLSTGQFVRTFFPSVPPERLGLDGEYDHSGLAKRVRLQLIERFGAATIETLNVAQRGRVVVLSGSVASNRILMRIVATAKSVYGASDVETHGVLIGISAPLDSR